MVTQNRAEKLVDDVMAFICHHGIAAKNHVGFRREDAKQLIHRIGKAYAEGMPLDGEQRRMDIANFSLNERHLWLDQAIKSAATRFIALLPEEEK